MTINTASRIVSQKVFHSLYLLITFFLFSAHLAISESYAQTTEDAPVSISVSEVHIDDNDQINATLTIDINDGWKVYGPSEKGDSIKKPPEISIDDDSNTRGKLSVTVNWPKAEKWESGAQTGHVYKRRVVIPITLKYDSQPNSEQNTRIRLSALACSENSCLPIEKTIVIPACSPMPSDSSTCGDCCVMNGIGRGNQPDSESNFFSTIKMLFFAFLGGLILNVMPCVLPVLGIKLKSIAKVHPDMFRVVFLSTALGMICSFWAFASIAIVMKYVFQTEMGWGTQFQNPFFVSGMAIFMTLFSLSMMGAFHFHAPKWAQSLLPSSNRSLAGAFFSGVLSVIMSTPCCAPFMGTTLGFALTQDALTILLIFTSTGIGFSFPYIIASFLPISKFVPKPGAWSFYIEFFMGVLMMCTSIWLLNILSHFQTHTEKLLSWALILCATLCIILYRFLRIRDASTRKIVGYVIPAICFIAFFLLPVFRDKNHNFTNKEVGSSESGVVRWVEWNPESMKKYLESGKIVFVDVTASWCFSCQMNKQLILKEHSVQRELAAPGIVAMIADYTSQSDDIRQFLRTHKRVGIPFNVIISKWYPQGIILSERLSAAEIIHALRLMEKLKQDR